jgi:hypothetical protein
MSELSTPNMDLQQSQLQSNEPQPPAKVGSKRGGHQMSPVWVLFTNEQYSQVSRSSSCKHCMVAVNHLKKSERVQTDLINCKSFLKAMLELDLEDRPDWPNERQPSKRAKTGQILLLRSPNHRCLSRTSCFLDLQSRSCRKLEMSCLAPQH